MYKRQELFRAIEKALGEELPIFAEDLGIITPEVEKLRDSLGYPGMKVLQFGFDGLGESSFLPHQLDTRNCICYTGTHDNDTTLGWYQHTAHPNQDKVRRYMNTDASSISWDFIRVCLGTIARYAIFPVQDLLNQGSEHRMNTCLLYTSLLSGFSVIFLCHRFHFLSVLPSVNEMLFLAPH